MNIKFFKYNSIFTSLKNRVIIKITFIYKRKSMQNIKKENQSLFFYKIKDINFRKIQKKFYLIKIKTFKKILVF